MDAASPPASFAGPMDDIDKLIVAALAEEGRIGYEALARKLDLSSVLVRQRTKRLLQSGAVVVTGLVHPSVFGLRTNAHITIGCRGAAQPVAEQIASEPDVALVSLVAGYRPIVAEIRTADRHSLTRILRRISATENVTSTETSLYLDIITGANVEFEPDQLALDDIDQVLLRSIQRDGRRSFADLGEDVGLSTAAARSRLIRMLDASIVKIEARVPPSVEGEAQFGIGVIARGLNLDPIAALEALPSVRFLATTLGRWTAVGTIHVEPGQTEWGVLDQVRAISGIDAVETWRHLTFLKDVYEFEGTRGADPSN